MIPGVIINRIYFTVSDIWGLWIILYFINRIIHSIIRSGRRISLTIIGLFKTPLYCAILGSWIVYVGLSFWGSLQNSLYQAYSVNYVMHEINIIILFICTLYLLLKEKTMLKFFYIPLAVITGFQIIIGFLQMGTLGTSLGFLQQPITADTEQNSLIFWIRGLTDGFVDPNAYAYMLSVLLILLFPFIRKTKLNGVFVFIVLLGALNIIFSQSRAVWLGMGAAGIFLYAMDKQQAKTFIMKHVAHIRTYQVVIFIIVASIVIVPRIASSIIYFPDTGGILRQRMIQDGWKMLRVSPWFGFGAGMSVRALLNNLQNGYINTFPYPVHFAYLQIAMESGVPAAIVFFLPYIFIIRAFVLAFHTRNRRSVEMVSSVSCILVTLIYFCFQPAPNAFELSISGIIVAVGAVSITRKQSSQNYDTH